MLLIHLRLKVDDFNLIMAAIRYQMDIFRYQSKASEKFQDLCELELDLCCQSACGDNYEIVPNPDEESEI